MDKIYNVEEIIKKSKVDKLSFEFFWGGYLSNWHSSIFVVDGIKYSSVEQYMMASKAILFDDQIILKEIMKENNPKEIKKFGRKVKNFDQKKWDENKLEIVYKGLFAKFSQDEKLKKYLINTKDKILVEASPYDEIWGIKMKKDDFGVENPENWKGTNYLGFLLMKVRDNI